MYSPPTRHCSVRGWREVWGPAGVGLTKARLLGERQGCAGSGSRAQEGGIVTSPLPPSPGSCKPTPHALPGRAQALSGGYLLWL